ncbi:NlpC/P60 family protein [Anaeromyxobacter oryzisoli]|uniref:NlpC/P60 family protein n=1 Tax=Anaeromyxobacter oryzisoli TaxID=2925408 RepID=UPI001F593F5D|nr:NlpC/P60 family protein [Anaeromyxobacter sp. SG63]
MIRSRSAPLALALALLTGCAMARPTQAEPGPAPAGAPEVPAETVHGGPASAPGADASPEGGDRTRPDAPAEAERAAGEDEADRAGGEVATPEAPLLDALRARILDAARGRLGTRPALDCSGYVLAAYRAAGVVVQLGPRRSRSESLHDASRPVTRPRPGDLAFFHDTYDRNRNGRLDDPYSHVALVEAVDGDVVTMLHRGGRIERIQMDLAHPSDPDANGRLRILRRRDPRGTRYLAGELFAAFGELLTGEFTRTLQVSRADDVRARHRATR